jgi:hypothetical protein
MFLTKNEQARVFIVAFERKMTTPKNDLPRQRIIFLFVIEQTMK